jgi:hypothetical protein
VRAGEEGPDAEAWRTREDVGALIVEGNAALASLDPAQLDFRQMAIEEVHFLADPGRVQRYIQRVSEHTNGGRQLTPQEARQELNRSAAAYLGSDWAELYGTNALATEFLLEEAAASGLVFRDASGAERGLFTLVGDEYTDPKNNLNALFGAYGDDQAVLVYLRDVARLQDASSARADHRAGRSAGAEAAGKATLGDDAALIAQGIVSYPGYVLDSARSDTIGPIDDLRMAEYYDALLKPEERGQVFHLA